MKTVKRILCMLSALCLIVSGAAMAETKLYDPVAIVSYNQATLIDWTPGYNPNIPGVLLELTHPEAMLSITASEKTGRSVDEYLSDRLDSAAETLVISNARTESWADPFQGDGQSLIYSYSYPDGDETHLFRTWVASREDMLIELTIDAWGAEAEALMSAASSVFIEEEDGFAITFCEEAYELTATLTDVIEGKNGLASVQLTTPGENVGGSSRFYPLAENSVILFPNPDDPSLFYPVAPDMNSLSDAIFTYEDSSDSPAVFHAIIENDSIIYMEYSLMQ